MLDFVKDLSIILAGGIAVVTFMTGTVQYIRQGRQQRASQFIEMRRRFFDDPTFKQMLTALASESPAVNGFPVQERRNLVGILEEVALLVDTRLIRPEVAYYMFGYYVRLIDNSPVFWDGLEKDGEYWRVFREFAASMSKAEICFSKSRRARI